MESRFYFRILLKDSKESDLKVLKVHKKLRDEAEHYLEPESKHLIGIAYFRQGKKTIMTPPSGLFEFRRLLILNSRPIWPKTVHFRVDRPLWS